MELALYVVPRALHALHYGLSKKYSIFRMPYGSLLLFVAASAGLTFAHHHTSPEKALRSSLRSFLGWLLGQPADATPIAPAPGSPPAGKGPIHAEHQRPGRPAEGGPPAGQHTDTPDSTRGPDDSTAPEDPSQRHISSTSGSLPDLLNNPVGVEVAYSGPILSLASNNTM